MISAILIVILISVVYYIIYKKQLYWQEHNVPCAPYWFLLGHTWPLLIRKKAAAHWIQDLYNSCSTRYAGVLQFTEPCLLIKDIELYKNIFIKDFDSFADHHLDVSEELDPLFGKNLFSLNGQRWKDMRTTLSPAFTGSKMRGMYILMQDCAKQFTTHFSKVVSTNKPLALEMKDIYSRFTNDIIATCVFGIKCDSLEEKDNEFYVQGKKASIFNGIKFMGYMICPKIMQFFNVRLLSDETTNYFRSLVMGNMATRERERIVRMDLIHLLMEARKGRLQHDSVKTDDDTGFATVSETLLGKHKVITEFTDDDLTAQALLFFAAGFDTVSTALSFLSHELAVNPDIQKKLQIDIDSIIQNSDGPVTYEALVKMKYLDMVVSESLRKWPQGTHIERKCGKPYTIEPKEPHENPLHLEPNTNILIPIYGIHRDPLYYEDPDTFNPERFSDENKINIHTMTYLPFGLGPRNCIGSRFALLVIKTIIFYLLSNFDLVVIDKTQIPLELGKGHITMGAEKGFWLGLQSRTNYKSE